MERLPNRQQKLVINELDHNVILFASAGTGKTFTVANRIKNIIESCRATPEEVLCVTFTVKACKEMADDIGLYLGLKAKPVTIKTIHSFCLFLLKCEAKKNNDHYLDLDVCDEVDEQDILYRLIEEKVTRWQLEDFIQKQGIASSIDDLAKKDVFYDPSFRRLLWQVSVARKAVFLSSTCEILDYDETIPRLTAPDLRFHCPFCRKIIEGQSIVCPKCGEDLRTYLSPISTAIIKKNPRRLPNIASEIKRCRHTHNLYTGNDEADYAEAFRLLDEIGKTVRLFTFYDPAERAEIYDQKLLLLFAQYGGRLMAEYDRFLQNSNLVDYDDIIITAARDLQNEETCRYWQNKYKYVIVDEMQDTSRLEYEVMSRIFEGCRSMMCGDYFQTIYSWRGSIPEAVLENYIHRFQAKIFMFNENYRATRTLARASFGYLRNTYPDLVGKYCPPTLDIHSRENGSQIQAKFFNGASGEAEFIYNLIRSDPTENPSSFCIMARSNNYISDLAEAFSELEKRVEDGFTPRFFTVERSAAFYKTSAVKDILAFLRVLFNNTDNASMDRLTQNFISGVGKATIEKIHSSGDTGVSMSSFLHPDTYSRGDCYATLIDAYLAGDIIVYDTETTGLDLTRDQVVQIAAVRYGQDGKPKDTFERIVIPTVDVSQEARDIIPFDVDEAVRTRGVPAIQAFTDFSAFTNGAVLVGHNSVKYDAPLIARQLSDLGLPPLEIGGEYDTLSLAKQFYPKLPNFKLATLCRFFSIANENAHNALGDVLATGGILFHILWNNILPTQEERSALLDKYQGKYLAFYSFLDGLKKDIYQNHASVAIRKIIEKCNLRTRYKTESSRHAVEDILAMFQDSDDSIDFVRNFVGNAAFSGSQIDSLIRKLRQIPIITVHQSKGCEFDTVVLSGCNNVNFPSFAAVKDGNEEEEKRIFYVAISRAKKRLILTCNIDEKRKHPITPSPYIVQIPSECVYCEEFTRGNDGTWHVAE